RGGRRGPCHRRGRGQSRWHSAAANAGLPGAVSTDHRRLRGDGRRLCLCRPRGRVDARGGLGGASTPEGGFGPASAMNAAVAAYTPNIPWARFGCRTAVRLNGEGTSAATPQVAAAVALWFEKYKNELPRDW